MLCQAGRKRLSILSVPIRTNATLRPSRLFKSVPRFIVNTGITMARAYTTYNPLRVFVGLGLAILFLGALPIIRSLLLYRSEEHTSELQSLMRISYAVFCLKKKNNKTTNSRHNLQLYSN